MPRLIAHRGMSALAPENTFAAFRECTEHGVGWFEFDVGLIADGTAVVIHDDTLDRTTDATGPVAALTAADLSHIDAGSWFSPEFAGERIPTLRAIIDLMNDLELDANLEIKTGPEQGLLVAVVMTELERLNPERQVLISSFDPRIVARVNAALPQWRSREHRATAKLAYIFDDRRLGRLWRAVGAATHSNALHPDARILTAKRVYEYRHAGYEVNTWTVNDVDRARELVAWGVNGIFTDIAHEFPIEWRS